MESTLKKMPSETNVLGAWSLLRGEIVTHWILIQIVHKFSLKLSALQVNSSNNNARGINFDSAIKEYYIANTRRCIGRLNHNSVIKQVEDGMIKLIPFILCKSVLSSILPLIINRVSQREVLL